MKRCPYCGKEYSDEYSVCAIDENPLESSVSTPPRPRGTSTTGGRLRAFSTLSQHTKAVWISGACVISTIVFLFALGLASGLSGGFGFLPILGCILAVKVIGFVAYIAFIVQGFRVHWGWGLANLVFGPLSGIVFFVKHRHEGRVPTYILTHGVILFFIFWIYARLKTVA